MELGADSFVDVQRDRRPGAPFVGTLSQKNFLRSLDLLGTQIPPLVDAEPGTH